MDTETLKATAGSMETETGKAIAGCFVHMPRGRCMVEELLNKLRKVFIPGQLVHIFPALICVCPSAKQKYQSVWKSISDEDMRSSIHYLEEYMKSHDEKTVGSVLKKVLKTVEEHLVRDITDHTTPVNQPISILRDNNQPIDSCHNTNQPMRHTADNNQPINARDVQNKPIRDLPALHVGLYRMSYIVMKALQGETEWYNAFLAPGEMKSVKLTLQIKFSLPDIDQRKVIVIVGNNGKLVKDFGKTHRCRVTLHDIAHFEGCHDVDVTIQKIDFQKNRYKLEEMKIEFIRIVEHFMKYERENWMNMDRTLQDDENDDEEEEDDDDDDDDDEEEEEDDDDDDEDGDEEERIQPRQYSVLYRIYEMCTIM